MPKLDKFVSGQETTSKYSKQSIKFDMKSFGDFTDGNTSMNKSRSQVGKGDDTVSDISNF